MEHRLILIADVLLLIRWLCIFWLAQPIIQQIDVIVFWVEVGEQLLVELIPHQARRLLIAELSQVVIEDFMFSV